MPQRMRMPAIVTAMLLAALLPVRASAAPVNLVLIFSNYYSPQTTAIAVGETVTWLPTDPGHTVTDAGGRFELPSDGTLARGQIVQWTFSEPGTFIYYCRVHQPRMYGVIVVGDGGSPASAAPTAP